MLNREATAFQREMEVERILKAFKLKCVRFSVSFTDGVLTTHSPYEMLDISEDATPEDIKKKYRQLSLCEHPTTRVPAPSGVV